MKCLSLYSLAHASLACYLLLYQLTLVGRGIIGILYNRIYWSPVTDLQAHLSPSNIHMHIHIHTYVHFELV